jgi:glyoxylase-like metal-dependent hydrolase (beta-lactamase superfamily II)
MLQMDDRELPCKEQVQFAERAGVKGIALAAFQRRRPSSFSQLVAPIPFAYHRLEDGDTVAIGRRQWKVVVTHGHAAGHATLWSDDGLALTGDQILPGISSNLSVHASEPDNDLVSEWLESCERLQRIASNATLCLPGHNAPFTGAATRCEQLIASMQAVLKRLLQRLERPATAVECLEAVYRRHLAPHEQTTLIAETVGFLNHLKKKELVHCELARDGSYVWSLVRNV